MGQPYRGIRARRRPFWENVQIGHPDECWPWLLRLSTKGYGNTMRFVDGVRVGGAHRIAWTLSNGPIPAGLHVLHHCDNPPCVNPDHLWLGTNDDNYADALGKGRVAYPNQPRSTTGRFVKGAA